MTHAYLVTHAYAYLVSVRSHPLQAPVIVVGDEREAAEFCSDPPDWAAAHLRDMGERGQWLVTAVRVSRRVDEAAPGFFGIPTTYAVERFLGRPGQWWTSYGVRLEEPIDRLPPDPPSDEEG